MFKTPQDGRQAHPHHCHQRPHWPSRGVNPKVGCQAGQAVESKIINLVTDILDDHTPRFTRTPYESSGGHVGFPQKALAFQ